MPYRYRRTRRRAASPTRADKMFRVSWVLSSVAAIIFFFIPISLSPDAHILLTAAIFLAPYLLILFFGCCWLLLKASPAIIIIWGPLGTIAWLYAHYTRPSDKRNDIVFDILASPFILGFVLLCVAFYGFLAWIAIVLLQNLFYAILWWRWVFCRPRFRIADPFAKTQLCPDCKDMFRRSGLFFGRWTLLTRSAESHQYNLKMQGLSSAGTVPCHFCLLMSAEYGRMNKMPRARLRNDTGYGTFSDSAVEGAKTIVKLSTGRWGLTVDKYSRDPDCYLAFVVADGRKSRQYQIELGPLSTTYPVISSTQSAHIKGMIEGWLHACTEHRACQTLTNLAFVPSRLVEVQRDETGSLQCRLADDCDLSGEQLDYIALSHCWGNDVRVVLTTTNYERLKLNIKIDALSKTFRDAIIMTEALGMRYIWIDSLCIVQDSEIDWSHESIRMMDVFANAALTISAAASSSSEGGCFRDRVNTTTSCKLVTSDKSELYLASESTSQTLQELFSSRVDDAPLTKRAWAFQERLLSRRIIHFCSDTVLFECNTLQASEKDIGGAAYAKEPYIMIDGRMYDSFLVDILRNSDPIQSTAAINETTNTTLLDAELRRKIAVGDYEDHTATRGIRGALDMLLAIDTTNGLTITEALAFNHRWFELVGAYSKGELTKKSDKLVAIAGVAGLVEKSSHAKYVAGMWSNVAIEHALLWRLKNDCYGVRGEPYRAPTWSWTSVEGPIVLPKSLLDSNLTHEFRTKVNRARITLQGKEVTQAGSHLDGGDLEISGPTFKVGFSSESKLTLITNPKNPTKHTISFWPDCNPEGANESDQLIALLVLSTKERNTRYMYDSLRVHGLVLKPNKSGTEEPMEMERVGTFSQMFYNKNEEVEHWLGTWERQYLRIL